MSRLRTALVLSCIPAATVAWAQDPTAEETLALEEIVVTARKREERLQDVPLSITAFSGKELEAAGIANVTDLAGATPGLSYATDLGRTAERPVVRGISALRPEAAQPVSVFLDGVYVRDGVLSLLLEDVQRVEVVKGPQSALYGRASYAGAINVVGKKPTDTLTGRVILTGAEDDQYEAFGVISGPLLADRLLGRLSVKHYEFGGQYTNELSGNKIGDEQTDQIEGSLLFRATDALEILLQAGYKEDRDGYLVGTTRTVPTIATVAGVPTIVSLNGTSNVANGAVCNGRTIQITQNNPMTGQPDPAVPVPATTLLNGWPCGARDAPSDRLVRRNEADLADYTDPRTGKRYGDIAGLAREQFRGSLTLNWNSDTGYAFTSQTAYSDRDQELGTDQSYNGTRFSIVGTPWTTFDDDSLQTFSQEFRITSPRDRPLKWLAGAFLYTEDFEGLTSNVIQRGPAPAFTVSAAPTRLLSPRTVDNYAGFAQLEFAASEQLNLSAELRYNWEKTRFGDDTPLGTATVTTDRFGAGQPVVINVPITEKSWAPRITANYKIAPDVMLYVQAAEGFKNGGINVASSVPASQVAYVGETVRAYEAGMKSEWLDRRLRANVAVFWNDISDLQLSQSIVALDPITGLQSTTTVVNNVGEARTRGAELEFDASLTRSLSGGVIYAYTDAEALQGFEITNGNVFGGDQSVAGAELPRSPKHSAAGYLQWSRAMPFGSDVEFESRLDVVYESRRYAAIQNLIWADPRTRVNLSASLSNDNWKASFWVKNLFNAEESVNGFRYLDPVTFRRTAVDWLPRLRQAGITVSYSFD
ncbi:MAG TPA: TonB-dependent receptor [Steroidobacteraceae bacterium]|nr:TonB-dependent receptor [Steroidobacteraceae bacterium]